MIKRRKRNTIATMLTPLMAVALLTTINSDNVESSTWIQTIDNAGTNGTMELNEKLPDIDYLGNEDGVDTLATIADRPVQVYVANSNQANPTYTEVNVYEKNYEQLILKLTENTAIKKGGDFQTEDGTTFTEIFTRALPDQDTVKRILLDAANKLTGKNSDLIKVGINKKILTGEIPDDTLTSFKIEASDFTASQALEIDKQAFNRYKGRITIDELKSVYSYTMNQHPFTDYLRDSDLRNAVKKYNGPVKFIMANKAQKTRLNNIFQNKDQYNRSLYNYSKMGSFYNQNLGIDLKNNDLTIDKFKDNGIEKQSTVINEFLQKNQITWNEAAVLYRGFRVPETTARGYFNSGNSQQQTLDDDSKIDPEMENKFKVGDIISDLSFSSFSMDKNISYHRFSREGDTVFVLEINSNQRVGTSIDSLSAFGAGGKFIADEGAAIRNYLSGTNNTDNEFPGESEILMPASTDFIVSRVKRNKVIEDGSHRTIVYLRIK